MFKIIWASGQWIPGMYFLEYTRRYGMILSVCKDNDISHVALQHLNIAGCLNHWIVWYNFQTRLHHTYHKITLCSCDTRTLCGHHHTTRHCIFPCLGKSLFKQWLPASLLGHDQGRSTVNSVTLTKFDYAIVWSWLVATVELCKSWRLLKTRKQP